MIQGPQTWLEMLFKDFIPYLRTWDSTLTWSNVLRLHLDLISISGDLTWTWLTDSTLDKDPIWWLQVQLGLHSMNYVLTLTCFKDSILDVDLIWRPTTWLWRDQMSHESTWTWFFVFVSFQMCWAVTTGPSSPTDRRPPGRHTPWRWAYLRLCTVTVVYQSINPGVKAIV